ncbi:MAG: prepilin-type N-terminal cleavage/methylation domain-containing protein [Acidobacteriota bacterium]
MMRRSPGLRRGVTLMELIVAMSLLGLLSVGILMALRIGLSAMEKTSTRMNLNRRVTGVHRILDNQIAGIIPALATCGASNGMKAIVFEGQPTMMRLVSSYSLAEAARGYPRLVEYLVIPDEKGEGVRLVVNEPYYNGPATFQNICAGMAPLANGGLAIRLAPPQLSQNTFILADQLARCQFSYQREVPGTSRREWVPVWRDKGLPTAIRFDMAALRPDPSRAQFRTLTLPVRVNRDPFLPYEDYEQPPKQ